MFCDRAKKLEYFGVDYRLLVLRMLIGIKTSANAEQAGKRSEYLPMANKHPSEDARRHTLLGVVCLYWTYYVDERGSVNLDSGVSLILQRSHF